MRGGAFAIAYVRSRAGDCLDAGRRISQQDERGPPPSSPTRWPFRGRRPALRRPSHEGPRPVRSARLSRLINRRGTEVAQHRPRGDIMATKITREIIESYLNCKYKGHLKLAGECGTQSDYEMLTTAARSSSREQAVARLIARFGEGDACQGATVTAATLKQGAPLLAGADLEDDTISLRLDALKRADGASGLGDHYYVPVLHNHSDTVGRQQKLLLAVVGLMLDRVQGLRPATGLVARGPEG